VAFGSFGCGADAQGQVGDLPGISAAQVPYQLTPGRRSGGVNDQFRVRLPLARGNVQGVGAEHRSGQITGSRHSVREQPPDLLIIKR
jgi:hypothetical protein